MRFDDFSEDTAGVVELLLFLGAEVELDESFDTFASDDCGQAQIHIADPIRTIDVATRRKDVLLVGQDRLHESCCTQSNRIAGRAFSSDNLLGCVLDLLEELRPRIVACAHVGEGFLQGRPCDL